MAEDSGKPPADQAPDAAAGPPTSGTPAKPAAGAAAGSAAPKPAAAKPAAGAAGGHPAAAAPPAGPPDPPPPADAVPPPFLTTLQETLPGAVVATSFWVGDWTVIVNVDRIVDVARHLRDSADAAFDLCSDVTATDWPVRPERFDVVYCLYSTRHRHRVRVKVRAAEGQPVPSVCEIWPAANWLEREVFDMFGVNITGHPDRRRILMPEDWQGYPERKDYPLEGPGELLMESPTDWLKVRQARDESDIE